MEQVKLCQIDHWGFAANIFNTIMGVNQPPAGEIIYQGLIKGLSRAYQGLINQQPLIRVY